LVLLDGHTRNLDQFLNELADGCRGIAVDGVWRDLPLGAVNPLRMINRGRDARSKLPEAIGTLL